MQDMQPDNSAMPVDNEGAMAKADLYKLANYSFKLFKQIDGNAQLEGWVQAKITKAADYIASVYHYMEYEMKFSEYGEQLENSDMYSESEKRVMMSKLMEAKDKVKELKKKQADKVGKKDMAVKEEKSSTGGEIDRSKKGVTKHTQNTKRFSDEPHTEPKSNAKSQSAADKAGDKAADKAEEKEGKAWEKAHGKGSVTRVKDGKKVDEGTTEVQYDKEGKRTGVKHKSTHKYSDEPHTEPKSQAKSRSAAEKAGDKAADKAAEKDSKAYEKKNPGTVSRYKDGKKVDEAAKPDFLDMDKDGNKKEPMKKAVADKKAGPKKGVNPFAKKNEGLAATIVKTAAGMGKKAPLTTAEKNAAAHAANKGKNMPSSGNAADDYDYFTGRDKTLGGVAPAAQAAPIKPIKEASKPDFLDMDKDGNKKEAMKKAVADKKKKGVKEAVAKAKAKMEGSIQGGVWVSSPDKGVAPPNDPDGGSAPAPKKAKSPFPSRNETDPAKKAANAAVKSGTANPAMPSRSTVKESADLDRLKTLTKHLLG